MEQTLNVSVQQSDRLTRNKLFPVPYSLFPIPCSLCSTTINLITPG